MTKAPGPLTAFVIVPANRSAGRLESKASVFSLAPFLSLTISSSARIIWSTSCSTFAPPGMIQNFSDLMPQSVARAIATASVFFLILGSATAMAKTLTLFSEIRGRVIQDGRPVSGAEVERSYRWHWKDQVGADKTTTDVSGEFSFPAVTGSTFLGSVMTHEPVIEQMIVIRTGGNEYPAWKYAKHNYDVNGEFPDRALRLRCDLADAPTYHLIDTKAKLGYQGICTLE